MQIESNTNHIKTDSEGEEVMIIYLLFLIPLNIVEWATVTVVKIKNNFSCGI